MSTTDHHFKIPSGLPEAELKRIEAIAKAFKGTPCSDGYLFSPKRGQKFELLVRTGWRFYGWQRAGKGHRNRATFTHPKHPQISVISDAVALARLIEDKNAP